MSQEIKKKKEKVRFEEEETVWMSLEDFKRGKVRDLHDIKNLRIEQDFNVSKPENCKLLKGNKLVMPLEGFQQDDETPAGSQRKLKNVEELQRIQYKKVIDGLDLWNNELKAKKRLESMNELQLIAKSQLDKIAASKKQEKDPELDMYILNSIVNMPEEELKKPRKEKSNEKGKMKRINDENEIPTSKSIYIHHGCEDNDGDKSTSSTNQKQDHLRRNSLIMMFPKSLSQIPNRPVTLTSLKLREVDDFKLKTVSRYVVDVDNKVVMKTDAQLQAEQNNQIINQIFKYKVQKVIESAKPQNKRDYDEIVNNQTAIFKKDTLAHFKSLHYLSSAQDKGRMATNLRDPTHPKYGTIEYKKLYNELFEDRLLKKNIKLEKEKQNLLSQTKYFDEKEKVLLEGFSGHVENCRALKETLNKLRVLLNINASKKKTKNDEIKTVGEEYNKEIRQYESANVNSVLKQLEGTKKKRTIFIPVNPFSDQIEMLQEKKLEALSEINKQIVELDEEQLEIQQEVENIQRDYQLVKEKKNEIKHQLKQHYMKALHTPASEDNHKSLVWQVIKLLNIKEQVTYNLFPDFLEEKNIQYLIEMAKLQQERSDKQATIKLMQKSERFKQMQHRYSQKMSQLQHNSKKNRNNSSLSVYSSPSSSIPTSQFAIESSTKLSSVKKPVFVFDNNTKDHRMSYQIEGTPMNFEQSQVKQNFDAQFREIKDTEAQVKDLFDQIEQAKQKEFERLCMKYLKEDNKDLQKIFFALFGYTEGQRFNYEFEKRRVKIEQLINANKTFQFSQVVGPQANIIARKAQAASTTLIPNVNAQDESSNNDTATKNLQNLHSRKMSTPISSTRNNQPYQLTNGFMTGKNRSSNNSLTENILEPIKNNNSQSQMRMMSQSKAGQIKSSVDLKLDKTTAMPDAFSLFSPRIPAFIKRKIFYQSDHSEAGTTSVGMISPRSPSSHGAGMASQSFNHVISDAKNVTFQLNEEQKQRAKKSIVRVNQNNLPHNTTRGQFEYQNPKQQNQQKTPFLSTYFNTDDKPSLSNNFYSPINRSAKSFNFLSPQQSDSKFSSFFQSESQQQNPKFSNIPKAAFKVSSFVEDGSNGIKQNV